MLWNNEKKRITKLPDCFLCSKFDKTEKKCKGFGIICFEYDDVTRTCVDPITKLKIKL